MAELDEDQSGYIELNEFYVLLIKTFGLKRRPVGPGQCTIRSLVEEGWSLPEARKAGYNARHFLEEGFRFDLDDVNGEVVLVRWEAARRAASRRALTTAQPPGLPGGSQLGSAAPVAPRPARDT